MGLKELYNKSILPELMGKVKQWRDRKIEKATLKSDMMHEAELEALRTMKDDMVKQKKKEILSQSSAKDKKNWFDTGSQGFGSKVESMLGNGNKNNTNKLKDDGPFGFDMKSKLDEMLK